MKTSPPMTPMMKESIMPDTETPGLDIPQYSRVIAMVASTLMIE